MILKLKIFWACIKKNWKAAALAVWSIAVWAISRRNSSAAIEAMEANKESYETQIKSLKEQHKIEVKKREELHLKYQETLVKIEEKYKKKKDELSKVEKKKVKEKKKRKNLGKNLEKVIITKKLRFF